MPQNEGVKFAWMNMGDDRDSDPYLVIGGTPEVTTVGCTPDEIQAMADEINRSFEKAIGEERERAFVAGAKWWEFQKTGATMWQTDQAEASEAAKKYAEAIRRLGDGGGV